MINNWNAIKDSQFNDNARIRKKSYNVVMTSNLSHMKFDIFLDDKPKKFINYDLITYNW